MAWSCPSRPTWGRTFTTPTAPAARCPWRPRGGASPPRTLPSWSLPCRRPCAAARGLRCWPTRRRASATLPRTAPPLAASTFAPMPSPQRPRTGPASCPLPRMSCRTPWASPATPCPCFATRMAARRRRAPPMTPPPLQTIFTRSSPAPAMATCTRSTWPMRARCSSRRSGALRPAPGLAPAPPPFCPWWMAPRSPLTAWRASTPPMPLQLRHGTLAAPPWGALSWMRRAAAPFMAATGQRAPWRRSS